MRIKKDNSKIEPLENYATRHARTKDDLGADIFSLAEGLNIFPPFINERGDMYSRIRRPTETVGRHLYNMVSPIKVKSFPRSGEKEQRRSMRLFNKSIDD